METTIFNDIWSSINENIEWAIVIIVWAGGYGIRLLKILPKWSTTIKVALASLLLTVIYALVEKTPIGLALVSYVFAFGFHTLVIKWIDRKISNKIGGELPDDDDEDDK